MDQKKTKNLFSDTVYLFKKIKELLYFFIISKIYCNYRIRIKKQQIVNSNAKTTELKFKIQSKNYNFYNKNQKKLNKVSWKLINKETKCKANQTKNAKITINYKELLNKLSQNVRISKAKNGKTIRKWTKIFIEFRNQKINYKI